MLFGQTKRTCNRGRTGCGHWVENYSWATWHLKDWGVVFIVILFHKCSLISTTFFIHHISNVCYHVQKQRDMWCLQRESWAACHLECEDRHSGSLFQRGISHFLKFLMNIWRIGETEKKKRKREYAWSKKSGRFCKYECFLNVKVFKELNNFGYLGLFFFLVI